MDSSILGWKKNESHNMYGITWHTYVSKKSNKVHGNMDDNDTKSQRAHRKQKKKNPSVIVAQENTWSSQQN